MTDPRDASPAPSAGGIGLGGAVLALSLWVLPILLLLPAGLWLLYGTPWFWAWLGFAVVSAGAGVVVWRRWRRRPLGRIVTAEGDGDTAQGDTDGKEAAAWAAIDRLAEGAAPDLLTDRGRLIGFTLDLVEAVATVYRPDDRRPLLATTVPELLLLSERVSRRMRGMVLSGLPLGDRIQLGHVARAVDFAPQWRRIQRAYGIWRAVRVPLNPLAAILGEARDRATRALTDAAMEEAGRRVLAILVAEVGQAAIDLYSGRLRLSPEELAAASRADMAAGEAAPPVPRVLLLGPSGAGKSALVNALGESIRAAVDPLPSTLSVTPYSLTVADRPTIVLLDSPGLDGRPATEQALAKAAEMADLILWVLPANRPARAMEAALATRLRASLSAPPPMLAAVTHIDRLPPHDEWAPPYALPTETAQAEGTGEATSSRSRKARAIASALVAVAGDLDLRADRVVPVVPAVAVGTTGLDALWAAVSARLPEAQSRALQRHLRDSGRFDIGKLTRQVAGAGKLLGGLVTGDAARRTGKVDR